MLTDKEWEEIRYSLVEGGYFDFEVRPKTLKAIRRVVDSCHLMSYAPCRKVYQRFLLRHPVSTARYTPLHPHKRASTKKYPLVWNTHQCLNLWSTCHLKLSPAVKRLLIQSLLTNLRMYYFTRLMNLPCSQLSARQTRRYDCGDSSQRIITENTQNSSTRPRA